MIISTIEDVKQYVALYPNLSGAIDHLNIEKLSALDEGKHEISSTVSIVKIIGEKKAEFDGILEVHDVWIDIHVPLTDDEIILFKPRKECEVMEKVYQEENDYMLYKEEDVSQLTLGQHMACIIDTNMCHMAMMGEGPISKVVFKIKK